MKKILFSLLIMVSAGSIYAQGVVVIPDKAAHRIEDINVKASKAIADTDKKLEKEIQKASQQVEKDVKTAQQDAQSRMERDRIRLSLKPGKMRRSQS